MSPRSAAVARDGLHRSNGGEDPGATSAGILLTENGDLATRQPSLIDRLKPADRERVRRHGRSRTFEPGETLFSQGETHVGIMIIETGLVRSFYMAPSGREITLAYWLPGNFVAGPEIFGGGSHIWSGIAAKRTRVILLPGQGLRALAREVPDLALEIIDALVFKAKCYSALAQMLGTRSVTERLGQLLSHLVNVYGVPEKDGTVIAMAFTHAEIANLIGGTRQWVTANLTRLQVAGIVSQRRGRIVVHHPDLLIDRGDGIPPSRYAT